MSARRVESPEASPQMTVQARQTQLSLTPGSVVIRRNGLEFRSPVSFAPWTEMTLSLRSPLVNAKVQCAGVVVACTGNRHSGYHVSLVFTSLSRQAEERLGALAFSALA